jgi:hypothetical protein
VREGATHGVEEHQVTGLQLAALDLYQAGHRRLLVGAARQHQADAHLEHMTGEAAAIEAGLGRGAAAAVAYADEIHRRDHHVGGLVVHASDQARLGRCRAGRSSRVGRGRRRGNRGRGGEEALVGE